MSDEYSLRTLLSRIDGTAPAIQKAASAMMKHYDRSATVAVNEWRSSLQACTLSQLLPLLYVANEVLQNSKRNRGNKFLEAMSPSLGQSLQHICSRDPAVVEKVRRTAKIWADRRVFSVRFVNELLEMLEPYRSGLPSPRPPPPGIPQPPASFSPGPEDENVKADNASVGDDSDDDIRNILEDSDRSSDEDHSSDDDDDIFASEDGPKLDIEVNIGSALEATEKSAAAETKTRAKRRRSSMSSSTPHMKRRNSAVVLSPANLLGLWARLSELQQGFERAQQTLARIDDRHTKKPAESLEHLVGDELQQAYTQNEADQKQMVVERKSLHAIAIERKALEAQVLQYMPWLEKALKQDQEDIQFCDMLEQKIVSFKDIHEAMTEARDKRLAEERRRQQEQEELARKKREKEEQERFKKAALKKETEAKPGMVWNPSTREYQELNTDESWRE
jgi:hypothetical protein